MQYIIKKKTHFLRKNLKVLGKLTLEGVGSAICATALKCRDLPWNVMTALGVHLWSSREGLKVTELFECQKNLYIIKTYTMYLKGYRY